MKDLIRWQRCSVGREGDPDRRHSKPAGGSCQQSILWTILRLIIRSNLDLLLSVTVNEIRAAGSPGANSSGANPDPRAGQKRLQVQYHRIRFSQEVAGQNKIQYDSDAPQRPIPLAALGYHGLKD